MKKNMLFYALALFSFAFVSVSCSSDDELDIIDENLLENPAENTEIQDEEWTTFEFFGMEIPYAPVGFEEIPQWMIGGPGLPRDEIDFLGLSTVCKGTLEGETIYYLHCFHWSGYVYGRWYHENGEPIEVSKSEDNYFGLEEYRKLVREASNWECIYHSLYNKEFREFIANLKNEAE